jgi:Domain of unknown function (DUF4266)
LARPSLIACLRNSAERARTGRALALLVVLGSLAGCSHVAPYEREYLARPGMDIKEREALRQRFYAHVYEAREGAMGSEEHAGGGCGCN